MADGAKELADAGRTNMCDRNPKPRDQHQGDVLVDVAEMEAAGDVMSKTNKEYQDASEPS